MSVTESSTMTTTVVRSECGSHRYLLSKVWDETKPKAMLVMLAAGDTSTVATGTTESLVVKNLNQLGFGSIFICNLFSNQDKESDAENDRTIVQTASECPTLIFGWGSGALSSPVAQRRIAEVLDMLKEYQANAYCIASPTGNKGLHPLAPAIRNIWSLCSWMEKPDEAQHQENRDSASLKKGKGAAI